MDAPYPNDALTWLPAFANLTAMPATAASSFIPTATESRGLIELRLTGHLSLEQLDARLAPISALLTSPSSRVPVLVDCSLMTGYDTAARRRFVEWNTQHKSLVSCLAIVVRNPLWKMVISAMSLASGQVMRPFSQVASARAWAIEYED